MKPLLQLGMVAGAYVLARAVGTRLRRRKIDPNAAGVAAGLRQMALDRKTTDVTAAPIDGVFGAIMELGVGGAAATLVGLVDGNASLYFSTGGGLIGGVGHEAVRSAASRLCQVAATVLDRFTSTAEFPLPERGRVRFYVNTENGVLTADSDERAVRNADHALHALYAAGQDLLTAVRQNAR